MDLQTRKIEFVQEFLKFQREEVVLRFEKMLRKEKKFSDDRECVPMTIEEFNNRIDTSMDDSKNGRIIKASDLKTKIDQWS